MKISNNTRRSLGIPGIVATILEPGASMEVTEERYQEMMQHAVLRQWFRRGMLVTGDASFPDDDPRDPPKNTKVKKAKVADENLDSINDDAPKDDEGEDVRGVRIEASSPGWFDVFVNGMKVNEKGLRKAAAKELAAEYELPEE